MTEAPSAERHRTQAEEGAQSGAIGRAIVEGVVTQQAVERDEARVDGNLVGTALVCDEPCRAGEIDAAVGDRLAIAPDGRKIGGQQQVVNEDRFALQAIRLNAADFDRAGGARRSRDFGVYSRFLPRLLDHGVGNALAGRDTATDKVIEHPGIDGLGIAAACEPHRERPALVDQSVDVRGERVHPEIACGGTLEQEPRRGAERGSDRVALVSPRREGPFGGQYTRHAIECVRARTDIGQRRNEGDRAGVHPKNVVDGREARGAAAINPADHVAVDAQRAQFLARQRQRGRKARANRRYNGGCDHRAL